MRTVLGIILLVACILLVGVFGLHFLGVAFSPQPSPVVFPEPGFAGMPNGTMAFHTTHDVPRSLVMLFAMGLLVLVLGGLGLVLLLSRGGSKETKALNGDEARIVQQINDGLSRMEKRVEALETILLDRTGRPSAHHEALDRER